MHLPECGLGKKQLQSIRDTNVIVSEIYWYSAAPKPGCNSKGSVQHCMYVMPLDPDFSAKLPFKLHGMP
jgi:hypothetical protein